MDDELEHSPRSWLDDFMQRFSWCCPSARASPFLNNYFLPGVGSHGGLHYKHLSSCVDRGFDCGPIKSWPDSTSREFCGFSNARLHDDIGPR